MVSDIKHNAAINLTDGAEINSGFGCTDSMASAHSAAFNKINVNKHADLALCCDSKFSYLKKIVF